MPRKLTQGDALERFIKKHGNEYNYSLVEYVDRDTKVKIICKKDGHGIFEQNPDRILGTGQRLTMQGYPARAGTARIQKPKPMTF